MEEHGNEHVVKVIGIDLATPACLVAMEAPRQRPLLQCLILDGT